MTTPPSEPGSYGGYGDVPAAGYTPPPPFGPPDGGPPGYGPAPQFGAPAYPPPGYGAYPPPAYGQPYPYAYYPIARLGTNGFAIASMVLGIVWIYWIGSILAIIFGHVALSQIERSHQEGRGMAIAGLVLGYIGLVVLVVVIVFAVALSNWNTDSLTLRL